MNWRGPCRSRQRKRGILPPDTRSCKTWCAWPATIASEPLRELARQKQVRLVYAEPPAHWGLNVDAGQVRTALAGMLRNAIEAAPPEGWAGLRVENGNGTLKLIVEDNGPGPAPSGLEH